MSTAAYEPAQDHQTRKTIDEYLRRLSPLRDTEEREPSEDEIILAAYVLSDILRGKSIGIKEREKALKIINHVLECV